MKFQIFNLDLEKAEEPEIKLPTSTGSSKRQDNSRKISTSALLTRPKPLTVWITRNCADLTEAEDTKKRWEKCTEELYKKDLHDPDNHDGVITHLEPDILECLSQVGLMKHH